MVYEYSGGSLQDGLYFFYAAWNSNCNVLLERITKLNQEFKINIYRVNTTRFTQLKQNLSVNRIPSYLWIKNEKVESRKEGNIDFFSLKKWIQERV